MVEKQPILKGSINNMTEKVKVSGEVAEALELARVVRSDETITNMCISKSFVADQEPLNNLNPYLMVKILINGYEVEPTPEEIIKKEYEELSDYEPIDRACKDSFRFILDTLGIKIKGVNK